MTQPTSPTKRELRAERAAAALRDQQRRERRRTTLVAVGVAALVVAIVAGAVLIQRLGGGDEALDAPVAGGSDYGLTVGDPGAPHEVVVYEDFLCPFCGRFEAASHEALQQAADDGAVLVEYRPINLLQTTYSVAAASAFKVVLDAAGPEVAKRFHDRLFANQPDEGGPYPDADQLVDEAVAAGAAEDDVRPGIEADAERGWVEDATAAATAANVDSTPTVLLDGREYQDGSSAEELAENLVRAVAVG